eukprot:IDg23193t1
MPTGPPQPLLRKSSIDDNQGIRRSCSSCSQYYAPLLDELSEVRMHGPAMRQVRANHVKNNERISSIGQNHNARRQWLWTYALDSHGYWIGHASCISKLTQTDKNTLSNLRNVYRTERCKYRKYPAKNVLENDSLLRLLLFDGDDEPEDWASLEKRREWLRKRIENTGDHQTPVSLPSESSAPPLHGNCFKKGLQKTQHAHYFKSFVIANSVPTSRLRRGKTHYLVPTIRRIRPPKLDSEIGKVSHDTVARWLKQFFPRHAISPVQSDYCDTCAELKRQTDAARRARQHLIDNGSASGSDILSKEKLIESYESCLRKHRALAAAEQAEYKNRIQATATNFDHNILNASDFSNFASSNEAQGEVVLACDFQMGKLIPHWGQSAQPGKTYYFQKILHHIFGIVDASNMQKHVYVVDETVSGDKDSDHVCSFIDDYVLSILSPRVRFLRLYLDSAAYFKNKYMTNELLRVIGACGVVPHELSARDMRRWKKSLESKYKDIPTITEWNLLRIQATREFRHPH